MNAAVMFAAFVVSTVGMIKAGTDKKQSVP